ncbi:MAG: hypothetical protein IK117_05045, partial [Bacteroidales bacterium]|nr:hypothetical protein [Bacteroidales bacterium]
WINENRITGSEWNGNPPQGEGYEAFVKIYKDFRDTCFENPNISFKDMDRYIWGSRKIESMKDSIRKEYTEYKNIWNSICENELNRYMNNNKTK